MVVDWILLADRSRASIRAALPSDKVVFPVLKCLEHAEGRLMGREMETDKPGRVQLRGLARRAAVEPHDDAALVESRRFAAEIAEFLEHEHLEGRFDRLHVIAPPAFLGVLRATWSEPFRRAIVQEVDSDLMTLPESKLKSRLEEILATAAE